MTASNHEAPKNHDIVRPGVASRRNVLMGVGALGAVAGVTALSACGSSSSTASPSGAGTTAGSTAGSTASASSGSGAAASPIAKTSDIPVGGGKIFTDQQVVVTQPTSGTFDAFSAVCTHQGCIVSSISNKLINCACHGSQYSIADGSVVTAAIPGQKGLPKKTATVANGEITVS